MSEPVQTHDADVPLDAQRFAEQIPAWVSGHLAAEQAQWMAEMAAQHPDWAQEAQWMRDFRSEVQAQARTESTDAAWAQLQLRLQSAPAGAGGAEPERALWQRRRHSLGATSSHRARLLRWWRSPVWGNVLASVALVVVLGHTAWQLLGQSTATLEAEAPAAAWRSLEIEDLAAGPQLPLQAWVQLPAAVSAYQWHGAVLALGAGVQVQPLADGRWLLHVPPTQTAAQWRVQLMAQPGLGSLQWQDVPVGEVAP